MTLTSTALQSSPELAFVECRTRWGAFYFVAKSVSTILGNTANGNAWANVRFITHRVLTVDEICAAGLSSPLFNRALAEVPENVNAVFIQSKILPTIHPHLVITDAWRWRNEYAERVIAPLGLIASISGIPKSERDAVPAIVKWDGTHLDEHVDITDAIGTQLAAKARQMAVEYPIETLVILCGRHEQIDDVRKVFDKLGLLLFDNDGMSFNMS